MAQVAAALGIDIRKVVIAAATKPYGFMRSTSDQGTSSGRRLVSSTYMSTEAERRPGDRFAS